MANPVTAPDTIRDRPRSSAATRRVNPPPGDDRIRETPDAPLKAPAAVFPTVRERRPAPRRGRARFPGSPEERSPAAQNDLSSPMAPLTVKPVIAGVAMSRARVRYPAAV